MVPFIMASAVQARATLTLEYLCDVLERAGMLTNDQRRDAVARGDAAHGRLLRLRVAGPRKRSGGAEQVHPAEVLASMSFGRAGDDRHPLGERAIMQALAAHVG